MCRTSTSNIDDDDDMRAKPSSPPPSPSPEGVVQKAQHCLLLEVWDPVEEYSQRVLEQLLVHRRAADLDTGNVRIISYVCQEVVAVIVVLVSTFLPL